MRRWVIAVLVIVLVALLTWANWPVPALRAGAVADRVLIEKSDRTLTLYSKGTVLRTYLVALGRTSGAKEREGDGKTPDGVYRVVEHKRDSAFHRALRLSYPETKDLTRARVLGVNPGSDIMIHGLQNGLGWIGRLQHKVDWTAGCIAVTDPEIEQIYDAVRDGTVVEIRP